MYKFAIFSICLFASTLANATDVYHEDGSRYNLTGSELYVDRSSCTQAREEAERLAEKQNQIIERALDQKNTALVNGQLFNLTPELLEFLRTHFSEKEIALKVRLGGSSRSTTPESEDK